MGIIKTAMVSGAAMYGVKQLARTAETRGNNSNNNVSSSRGRGAVDAEYLEWVEWKRRSAQSAPPEDRSQARSVQAYNNDRHSWDRTPYRQNLYLTQESSPPSYDYPSDDRPDTLFEGRYQPMNFAQPRQQVGYVEDVGQSRSGRGNDIGTLIGQGMTMLQSQGGKDGKGDFASKFLNK